MAVVTVSAHPYRRRLTGMDFKQDRVTVTIEPSAQRPWNLRMPVHTYRGHWTTTAHENGYCLGPPMCAACRREGS